MAGNLDETTFNNPNQKQRKGLDLNKYVKYFLHGLAFTLIMFILTIGWVFILIPLAICGFCFGIAIALAILVYAMGWVNTWLMGAVWGKEKMDEDWWAPLLHGAILFAVLLVLSVPWYAVRSVVPEIDTWPFLLISIVVFFIYCFIDGFTAYYVGSMFSENFARPKPQIQPIEASLPLPPEEPKGPSPPGY
jgi:hypothetical protein